ncbi:MAG TPA: hypothetical protein DDZ80_22075 [Cyanobacteria bacterium UBA8803]|nr:hypothetical protein [Cyanobacteria bacterium UBA9273]HBL61019.1 hypothetical protein [Cyanobacteria bacterium UBA8803]
MHHESVLIRITYSLEREDATAHDIVSGGILNGYYQGCLYKSNATEHDIKLIPHALAPLIIPIFTE